MTKLEFTLQEAASIAGKILKGITPGSFIALSGNLAAGKTTLTQLLLEKMGYEGRVSSPTYVLEHRYPVRYKKIREVLHLDLYRLSASEIKHLDWEEYRSRKDVLVIIEWPELAKSLLPKHTKFVNLEIIDEKTRRITLPDDTSC